MRKDSFVCFLDVSLKGVFQLLFVHCEGSMISRKHGLEGEVCGVVLWSQIHWVKYLVSAIFCLCEFWPIA